MTAAHVEQLYEAESLNVSHHPEDVKEQKTLWILSNAVVTETRILSRRSIHLVPGKEHSFTQMFTFSMARTSVRPNIHLFKKLRTEQPWSGAALPTPPDMTMVGSARVQNRTTSAPKLDPPPSPVTMGCWHAITIKAGTPLHHNHHSGYTPHHLFSPSTSPKKSSFLLYHFPPIVPWCPAFSELCGV